MFKKLFLYLLVFAPLICYGQHIEIYQEKIFKELPDRVALVDSAQYHSPLLTIQKIEAERIELELRINRNEIWKDFKVFTQGFYTNTTSVIYNDISNGQTPVYSDTRASGYQGRMLFGINFQFSLIDLLNRPKQLRKDRLELQQTNLELRNGITEVRTTILRQYFALGKAQLGLASTIKTENEAYYAYKKGQQEFEAGLLPLEDLGKLEKAYSSSQTASEEQKMNVLMEFLILEEYVGLPLINFYNE
ncbi:TolC family protein [Persicobacter sp. CCB-QB2]|uniref:TolC family protein n=1 Tax=Persicobacter sp. CCB-QB2 TaxID=1561025 RepID=UPI0006A9C352|nr:TolC family protein [Persicobacter sp. CCB-QB2]